MKIGQHREALQQRVRVLSRLVTVALVALAWTGLAAAVARRWSRRRPRRASGLVNPDR